MYKHLNNRIVIYTRRNRTESNYLSKFIDWCECLENPDTEDLNLVSIIEALKKHKEIENFKLRLRVSATYTGGSVCSIEMAISNSAFKIPVVGFVQNYSPGELSKNEAETYIAKLEEQLIK